jgi:integrase/recombinase XerD
MSDPQRDAKRISRILKTGGYDYDGSKYLFKLARKAAGLKAPKGRRGMVERLNAEEAETFIQEAYEQDGRTGLMLRTLLETALRVSKFVALQVEDISFSERLINVKRGKRDRRRGVPITRSLARELRIHIGGRNTGPLFASPRGGGYSTRRIQQIVKEVAQSADLEKRVSAHLLRHTMATRLVNGGMPMEHIRKILGHESTDTTQIYAETGTTSLRDSLDAVTRQRRRPREGLNQPII